MSCSPSVPFHNDSRLPCTSSCITTLEPVDSSRSTAPRPPTPFSQEPSVNTSAVFVLMVIGMVLGRTLLSRTRTSSHQAFSCLDWNLPLSTKEKMLKHEYFKDLPAKYPVAKLKRPWISCASAKLMLPDCWIPRILEEIVSIFQGHNSGLLQVGQV